MLNKFLTKMKYLLNVKENCIINHIRGGPIRCKVFIIIYCDDDDTLIPTCI